MRDRSRRRFLQASVAVGILSVTGCLGRFGDTASTPERQVDTPVDPPPGTWPTPLFGPQNTAASDTASPPRSTPTTEWTVPFDGVVSTVVVGPDYVYASSGDRTVAIDDSGTEQWALSVGGGLSYVAGRLYVAGDSLVALDASTGEEQWRAFTADDSPGSVHEASGTVYVAGRGVFVGLHADTGERLWEIESGRRSCVVADGDRVGLVGGERVRFFEPGERAERLLRAPEPTTIETIQTDWGRDVIAPALLGDDLFVPEFGDRIADVRASVRRYDLVSTDERWMTPFDWSGVGALAVDDEHVYAAPYRATTDPPDGSLVALDRRTGREQWRFDGTLLGGPVVGGATVVAGGADPGSPNVCISSGETESPTGTGSSTPHGTDTEATCSGGESPAKSGVLHGFDAATGDRLWSIHPGASFGGYPLALAGDRIYFGDSEGVHALA